MLLRFRRALRCVRSKAQFPVRSILAKGDSEHTAGSRLSFWVGRERKVGDAARAGVRDLDAHEVLEIFERGVGRAVRAVARVLPLMMDM